MRHLARSAAVLAVTMGVAHAGPPWSEFGRTEPLRPAEQLVETSCDMSIELRGAIADVTVQQRVTNTGAATLAATSVLELPPGAHLIGMSLRRGRGKTETALPVTASTITETVTNARVLGADPAIVSALPVGDNGRPRFRVIVQPLDPGQEITLSTRWTVAAEIRKGSLRLLLPGRGDGAPRCRGLVQVQPGKGATVERIRLDDVELAVRNTASFELGADDATLSAVLAFRRMEPVVWTQSMPLGAGTTARAITIVTPAPRRVTVRRALLVIDGSRSMELVGRHNVQKLVRAIGAALPRDAEVEAVIYDRTAARVLGAWKPMTVDAITAIETAIATRQGGNGSDTAGAFTFARQLLAGVRGPTLVISISDGVLGEPDLAPDALAKALGGSPGDLDVHALVLSPGRLDAPDGAALRRPVSLYGGAYVEVRAQELAAALPQLDEWLQPAWHELALGGADVTIPDQLRAGSGVVVYELTKHTGKLTLTGHRDAKLVITAGSAPAAPFAQLALADAGTFDETARATLRERHPSVDEHHALAVLSNTGSVAASRRQMIAGGGPFTRMVEVDDPAFPPEVRVAPQLVLGGSAVDRNTITLLLRQYLQPAAFTCYQRALAHQPSLAGTVQFRLEIGRGELTRAQVTGLDDATFDACLTDAAYQVTPPLPNPDFNTDDRTLVNYPLTFSIREHKPFVVAGDADSASPLDIDKIEGGVPARARGTVKAGDTTTPLGDLRPSATP